MNNQKTILKLLKLVGNYINNYYTNNINKQHQLQSTGLELYEQICLRHNVIYFKYINYNECFQIKIQELPT